MSKYKLLEQHLRSQISEETVSLTFAEISRLVGDLPPSAYALRTWWANSGKSQSKGWMGAGRLVETVKLGEFVTFSSVGTLKYKELAQNQSSNSGSGKINRNWKGSELILDGVLALEKIVKEAGYKSTLQLLATQAIFLHQDTVAQTKGKAVFPVIRNQSRRGNFDFEKNVLYGDNSVPSWLFEKSSNRKKGPDIQFNHVWSDSTNSEIYTALWNICVTPAFLAKTTDGKNHPEVRDALIYRSYELFGYLPKGAGVPERPVGYDELKWAPSLPPVEDLESVLRASLKRGKDSEAAKCARKLGWLFSNGKPDASI